MPESDSDAIVPDSDSAETISVPDSDSVTIVPEGQGLDNLGSSFQIEVSRQRSSLAKRKLSLTYDYLNFTCIIVTHIV